MVVDVSREQHNSSPMPGVAPNPDPALDISKEHHHEHLHHSANAEKGHAEKDHVAYTMGTTVNEPSVIPPASPLEQHDLEKGGLQYGEKSSLKGEPVGTDSDVTTEEKKHRWRSFYRRYRIVFHALIGAFFTG